MLFRSPVHLQDPQLPLEECLGPFRIPPEARHHFTNVNLNGEGFAIDIRHRDERLQRFDSEESDKRMFLHLLINVLHLLISHHDIGLAMLRSSAREYSAKKTNWSCSQRGCRCSTSCP